MTDARRGGDIVIVTGASQGLGRAIAVRFGRAGASVVLAARNRIGLEETERLVRAQGGRGLVVEADVSDENQVQQMVQAALSEYGAIDGLVCNSGVAGPTSPLTEITLSEWRDTFAVNVDGVFLCCRAAIPALRGRRGWVTVIGSMTGKRPLHGRTPYTTSKMALVGLVRTLAWETGPDGIRVNLLSPGAVRGPRIDEVVARQARALDVSVDEAMARFTSASPLGRLTEPEEVADAALFLGSPAASAITGEDVNVSAGVAMY